MRNYFLFFIFLGIAGPISANECRELSGFYPFKAGVLLKNEGKHEEAFDVFCNLAYRGDYRAQFQLAQYYFEDFANNINTNSVYALTWAELSNSTIKSKNRLEFIRKIKRSMITPEIAQTQKLYALASRMIATNRRIDQQLKPLDWKKIKKKIYKEYTGSRIKRKEPFGNVKIAR